MQTFGVSKTPKVSKKDALRATLPERVLIPVFGSLKHQSGLPAAPPPKLCQRKNSMLQMLASATFCNSPRSVVINVVAKV